MMEHKFSQVLNQLRDPFPKNQVRWLVADVSDTQAFVIPFVEAVHYKTRLDEVAPGWKNKFESEEKRVRCRVDIEGEMREGCADIEPAASLGGEFAADRAFIQACQGFGLGEYLNYLPGLWVDYDPVQKKVVAPAPVLPAWALPGGAGYPANVPGKPQPATKNAQVSASSSNPAISAPQPMKSGDSKKVQESAPFSPAETPTIKDSDSAEKQSASEPANENALKAWGDLVLKAKKAGITDIEAVASPIQVGQLRERYKELKDRLSKRQNGQD